MLKTARILIIFSVLMLSACQTFKIVEPNQPTKLGNFEIKTEKQWSQYNSPDKSIKILTRDGVQLNVISVINVKDDQHIYKQRLTEQNKGFKFDESMTVQDAAELYLDALHASNVHNVDILDETHTQVSGQDALKLEYIYDTQSGLTYHQYSLIVKHNGQLDILNCFAPEEYYFQVLENEFTQVISSARIIGES